MKTPEQLADEYAAIRSVADESVVLGANPWTKAAFLAGYQAAQPQWISVKDRLPEYTPMVLAMCTDGYELAYYGMYGQGWSNTLGTEHLNVTHWYPLPAPPNEDEK